MNVEIVTKQKMVIPDSPKTVRFDDGTNRPIGQLSDDHIKKYIKAFGELVKQEAARQRETK